MKQENQFIETGKSIKNAELSQMFGKPCFKINGKAFCCFFQECMVFKLAGEEHKEALSLKGSILFDPSGKGRAMKEWVQVPYIHYKKWEHFAKTAAKYVEG
ncbi:MAG: hypothetical protein IPP15_24060 [Saprospiraceae bacterium]|uniref:TfoX N-terminal domain-containing protein n=1 Tax=Candidatus Opimibacter skivensis TaxID=2982028 RepID=A0A9D7XW68_9BACT|nr:hypothetical protein [Candidatus Opimibacter skivensis]